MTLQGLATVILRTGKRFMKDEPMTMAASLAFYTVISLPAILILAVRALDQIFSDPDLQNELLGRLHTYFGRNVAQQADVILENVELGGEDLLTKILGIGLLVFSATTVFISLQDGLNKIWKVQIKPQSTILKMIFDRLLSFAVIMGIGFILLVSLLLDSALALLSDWLIYNTSLSDGTVLWIFNGALSLVVATFIFALIFKYLPDVEIEWRHVLTGAFLTSMLFILGKILIGLYLSTVDVGSAYGASGSLVVFLFWVYYSSTLVFLGAKFTFEYTHYLEYRVQSSDLAEFVHTKQVKSETSSESQI